jgi:tRNA G10  N-methylase Trm11
MTQTISQMIWSLINSIEASKNNYDPVTLSEKIIELSCLYANLTAHIADKENAYQQLLGKELDKDFERPTNKIEMFARRSDEYRDLKKAQALEKATVQIIRAANKFIRIKESEQSISKYQ